VGAGIRVKALVHRARDVDSSVLDLTNDQGFLVSWVADLQHRGGGVVGGGGLAAEVHAHVYRDQADRCRRLSQRTTTAASQWWQRCRTISTRSSKFL